MPLHGCSTADRAHKIDRQASWENCINFGAYHTKLGNEVKTITTTTPRNGSALPLQLEGRLDTTTSPQLEAELSASLDGVTQLTLDLQQLAYLSSAGLRVILGAQKRMNKQGQMVVRHVNETIMEVFEVTGFVDILTIEA